MFKSGTLVFFFFLIFFRSPIHVVGLDLFSFCSLRDKMKKKLWETKGFFFSKSFSKDCTWSRQRRHSKEGAAVNVVVVANAANAIYRRFSTPRAIRFSLFFFSLSMEHKAIWLAHIDLYNWAWGDSLLCVAHRSSTLHNTVKLQSCRLWNTLVVFDHFQISRTTKITGHYKIADMLLLTTLVHWIGVSLYYTFYNNTIDCKMSF